MHAAIKCVFPHPAGADTLPLLALRTVSSSMNRLRPDQEVVHPGLEPLSHPSEIWREDLFGDMFHIAD